MAGSENRPATGRLSEPPPSGRRAALAQSAERFTRNEQVVGSIPTGGSLSCSSVTFIDLNFDGLSISVDRVVDRVEWSGRADARISWLRSVIAGQCASSARARIQRTGGRGRRRSAHIGRSGFPGRLASRATPGPSRVATSRHCAHVAGRSERRHQAGENHEIRRHNLLLDRSRLALRERTDVVPQEISAFSWPGAAWRSQLVQIRRTRGNVARHGLDRRPTTDAASPPSPSRSVQRLGRPPRLAGELHVTPARRCGGSPRSRGDASLLPLRPAFIIY
jgi:hypothetical protein